jgi:hypothetical protein
MRVSTVNDLYAAGISETDIIKRTRHRTVTTLKSYRREDLASTSRASDALAAPSRVSTAGEKRKNIITVGRQEVPTTEAAKAKIAKQDEELTAALQWIEAMESDEIAKLTGFEDSEQDVRRKSAETNTNVILPIDLQSVSTRVVMNTGSMNISTGMTVTNSRDKNVGTELSFHAGAEVFFIILQLFLTRSRVTLMTSSTQSPDWHVLMLNDQ